MGRQTKSAGGFPRHKSPKRKGPQVSAYSPDRQTVSVIWYNSICVSGVRQ
jgi:hypothetical protein